MMQLNCPYFPGMPNSDVPDWVKQASRGSALCASTNIQCGFHRWREIPEKRQYHNGPTHPARETKVSQPGLARDFSPGKGDDSGCILQQASR
jgi:hypothetical protein